METSFHYDTAAMAINELERQGFTIDFNLEENTLTGPSSRYQIDQFHIADIYRYEGNSDPADEVIVYAISSVNGEKGIYVAAYGTAPDGQGAEIIANLKMADQI